MLLFNFRQPQAINDWSPVDDVVMGGVSSSRLTPTPNGTAIFTGRVSLENNGGFASITSSTVSFDLREYKGIAIHLRGDGKRYAFILRNPDQRPRYHGFFATEPNAWETVYLPFDRLVPRIFGMTLPVAPKLDRRDVTSCGFIVSDQQAGAFMLEIEWVAVYPMED
jgi:hypothetical protein